MANIKVGANTGDFQKQMKAMVTQLKEVNSEFTLSATKAKLYGTEQDKLKVRQQELTAKIKLGNEQIKIQSDYTSKLTDDLVKQKNKQEELKGAITKSTAELEKSIKTSSKNSDESKKLKEQLNNLKEEYAKNEKAIESTNKKLSDNKIRLQDTQRSLIENQKALENVEKTLKNIKLDNLASSLDKVASKTGGMADKMAPMAHAIEGIGVASATMSMNFEDGMAKVSTIADESKVNMKDLTQGVLDLSKKSGKAPHELAEALYEILSAGVDTNDAIDFLSKSVDATKAGFTDTATAVDGLTTVLNTYGMESKNADVISNQMLITQNLGKTTFDELAKSIGQVAPVASAVGLSTEELFSSLASTTAQGLNTSESCTALKAAISNIIKPSKEAGEVAEQLGIDFSVSGLKSKGWIGFLQDIKEKLKQASPQFEELSNKMSATTKRMSELEHSGKKNTDEYKKLKKEQKDLTKEMELMAQASDSNIGGFASLFGSVEGLNSILMLTSDSGVKTYNSSIEQMKTNTTAVEDACLKMSKTSGTGMKKSLNDARVALISFGDAISPFISTISGSISKISNLFINLSDGQKTFIANAGAFIVGTQLSLRGISKFTKGISNAIDGFIRFKDIGGKAVETIGKFGGKALETAKHVGDFAVTCGKTLVDGVVNGAKAIGNMTINLAKLTGEFIKNAIHVGASVIQWTAHKIAVIASTIATKAMEVAQATLNFVMALNPITLIIIGITGLVAGLVLLYNKCDWFRSGVNSFIDAIKRALQSLKDKWDYMIEKIGETWEWLKSKFKLPHFKMEGSFSLTPPSIPRVGVDWYWNGGIVDEPTILGNNIGVGDRFNGYGRKAEAIIPLDSMYRNIDSIVSKRVQQVNHPIYVLIDNTIDVNGKAIKVISTEVASKVKKIINKEQENLNIGRGVVVA